MITPETANYILYTCVAVGLSAITYFIICEVQDWLKQRKQYAEAHRLATENYINGLLAKIARQEDDIREYAFRELGYLNERKVMNSRMSFMARELSFDDMDKKTLILRQQ